MLDELPVMEQFYTIQGEGTHTGSPAYFIRLGGCDVGCFWCDVKESWDAAAHPKLTIQSLVDSAKESGAPIAVITGGEPCMHNLTSLTKGLQEAGIRTHLETSGAHPLTGSFDFITLSPKKFKSALDEFYAVAHELKVIVYNKHDLKWAESHVQKLNDSAARYLQPEWDVREESVPMILNYVRNNPHWKISLQSHKYIGIP
ncbi:MAG: 7-carboxy-7-deazaguanine synthase QueE [Flavobacteriales bacterium]|nr:7-carboxy-7-deazaguanine synthase QueE [Flavobacteriales bacterium]MDG1780284.1 7-carboxy-7-deazaguanine synthase QueE [Flavobacteriales bacterium]MDG2245345.1 7-carboxy-7-deazaguanine synthase QueE [Flavobacteriales bacterium]